MQPLQLLAVVFLEEMWPDRPCIDLHSPVMPCHLHLQFGVDQTALSRFRL